LSQVSLLCFSFLFFIFRILLFCHHFFFSSSTFLFYIHLFPIKIPSFPCATFYLFFHTIIVLHMPSLPSYSIFFFSHSSLFSSTYKPLFVYNIFSISSQSRFFRYNLSLKHTTIQYLEICFVWDCHVVCYYCLGLLNKLISYNIWVRCFHPKEFHPLDFRVDYFA